MILRYFVFLYIKAHIVLVSVFFVMMDCSALSCP